jgi:hypothetical protein
VRPRGPGNEDDLIQARAALTVALGQAVEQLIVIGSFALKECCGWEGNAG